MTSESNQNETTINYRVALFGTFDVPNFGDCLFPLIVQHQLNRRLESVTVLPVSPTNRVPEIVDYSRVYAFHELPDLCPDGFAAFIVGGGAILATRHVLFCYPQLKVVYPYPLKCWLLPAMLARAFNIPIIFNAIGMEKFDIDFAPLTRKYLSKPCRLAVRDTLTHRLVSDMGVSAEIIPDSGLVMDEHYTQEEWQRRYSIVQRKFNLPESFIAVQISLYLGKDLAAFAEQCAEAALELELPIVLVPICHHINDLAAHKLIENIIRKTGCPLYSIRQLIRTTDTAAILSQSRLFVGSSLHGALVSLAFGKAIVSFTPPAMKKNSAVLSTIGLENTCTHSIDSIKKSIMEASRGLDDEQLEKLQTAKKSTHLFFDELAETIVDSSHPSHPLTFSMTGQNAPIACASIQDDLDILRELCVAPKRRIPLFRRIGAVCIRNSRFLSEQYDRLKHIR